MRELLPGYALDALDLAETTDIELHLRDCRNHDDELVGLRATGFALNILVIHALGDVISPVIIGILSDRYSMNVAFLSVGLMILVAGILWLFGARHLARVTQLAPTKV